jgi:tRNA(Arg) A34 adenosine deaminase TadA
MPIADDARLLRRAIELSAEALASGNPPFGSLLAGPDGAVLAEERNSSVSDADITAHPELKLARWAAASLDRETAGGITMYTSCQPCGMCTGAIERSGLGRVVYAMSGDELGTMKPASAGPFPVPQEHAQGLLAEAGVPVRKFYAAP